MSRISQLVAACALALAAAGVSAQTIDPNSIVNAGAQVTKMIDEGRYGEVWEGASVVTKRALAKAAFIAGVAKARQALGTGGGATNRSWIDISRREAPGTAELPAGVYVNVAYQATFASGKPVRELVSFRLDEDKIWRVTGYVVN